MIELRGNYFRRFALLSKIQVILLNSHLRYSSVKRDTTHAKKKSLFFFGYDELSLPCGK